MMLNGLTATDSLTSFTATGSSHMEESLIPMINIIFLMLIFFMVAGQIRYQSDKEIDLPISTSTVALDSNDIELLIDRSMTIEYNGKPLSLNEIPLFVKSMSLESDLVLRIDKEVAASQVDELLTILRVEEISKIKLVSHTLTQ